MPTSLIWLRFVLKLELSKYRKPGRKNQGHLTYGTKRIARLNKMRKSPDSRRYDLMAPSQSSESKEPDIF